MFLPVMSLTPMGTVSGPGVATIFGKKTDIGVGVDVGVAVLVAVLVAVFVGVNVTVEVGVAVFVGVFVAVAVAAGTLTEPFDVVAAGEPSLKRKPKWGFDCGSV